MTDLVVGNARTDSQRHGGWIVGHFIPEADLRQTQDVEIKWSIHTAGEERGAWAESTRAMSVGILIRGRFRYFFPGNREVVLEREGDYVIWPAGVAHSWRAEEDCVLVTVRWPSVPGDVVERLRVD